MQINNLNFNPNNEMHLDKKVADMKEKNPHVTNLNNLMLKDMDEPISNDSQQAHKVVQWLLTAGFPASVIPAFYHNPQSVCLGMGVGIVIGGTLRFISTSQLDANLKNFQEWGKHIASMNLPSKITYIGAKTTLSIGNTFSNLLVKNNDIYNLLQGAFIGSHVGFEITGIAMTAINQMMESKHVQNSLEDTKGSPNSQIEIDITEI